MDKESRSVYCTPFYWLIAGIKGEEITRPKKDEILMPLSKTDSGMARGLLTRGSTGGDACATETVGKIIVIGSFYSLYITSISDPQ